MNSSKLILTFGSLVLALVLLMGTSIGPEPNSKTSTSQNILEQQQYDFPNYLDQRILGLWKADSSRTTSPFEEENHFFTFPLDTSFAEFRSTEMQYAHEVIMFYNRDSIGRYSIESRTKIMSLDSASVEPCASGISKITVKNHQISINSQFRGGTFELKDEVLILRNRPGGFTLIDSIYTYYSKIAPRSYTLKLVSSFPTIRDCRL